MILVQKTHICILEVILPSSCLKVPHANPEVVGFFGQPGAVTDLKSLNSFKSDKLKLKNGLQCPHPL